MIQRIDGRVLALALGMACTCLLGWLFKAHCMPQGWTGAIQYISGCYSDAPPFWGERHVGAGRIPYFQTPMEYPVLTGLQIWIEGALARGLFGAGADGATFLAAVSLGNALLAALILTMFVRAGLDRVRLWLWACAPPLILYLGHNWDLGAVTLAVAAMLAARRQRLVLAAALAALGAAAKLFPVLLLPLIGLAALTAPGQAWRIRMMTAARCALAAIGTWAAVNLPVALAAPENWSEFYRFSAARPGTVAATWSVLSDQGVWVTGTAQRNLAASFAFLLGATAIVGLGWRKHRERLLVLFTPVLAWFLLTNKVWSPQFDLWLFPLLVMTGPRLTPIAVFVIGDIAAYVTEFWWLAGLANAWPYATQQDIMIAASVRAVAMLWLIADAVRLPAPAWITRAPA
ncbi:hypothetical protein [Sphingomonas sp.]|uniref:hypothetical protein n=1 Tax=Sphingomonas sp. TaxID=28214 RepID=UPI0028A7E8F9|nr:hypothetical protein [Sphingomonas sp.]